MVGEIKTNEKGPTIRDISDKLDFALEALGTLGTTMDERFLISDKRFIALNTRIDGIDGRLSTLQRDFGKMNGTILDIQDDLTAALAAIDTDSLTLQNHERRIVRLEKR